MDTLHVSYADLNLWAAVGNYCDDTDLTQAELFNVVKARAQINLENDALEYERVLDAVYDVIMAESLFVGEEE